MKTKKSKAFISIAIISLLLVGLCVGWLMCSKKNTPYTGPGSRAEVMDLERQVKQAEEDLESIMKKSSDPEIQAAWERTKEVRKRSDDLQREITS